MTKKSAVVGYIRVSSEEQAKSGLSIENQERKIRAQAETHDLRVDRIYRDEGRSGKNLERPAMEQLLAEVEKGNVQTVIIYKLDRLTRSVADLARLIELFEKKGVALTSVMESLDTSSASGRLVVNMIGVVAQWERETIAERTKAALDVKRGRNEKLGGKRPYGYLVRGKKLVPHSREQTVLQEILRLRKLGHEYQDIAEALNEKNVRPREGRRWYASTVRAICLRAGLSPRKGGDK